MKKVIIYDDDQDMREVCSIILEARSFEVIIRDNCTHVLSDLAEHAPDVVLMDNWIPDIGGIRATQLIKESAEWNRVPVIIFSANNNIREIAAEAGADFFLQKPFDISELEKMVTEAISR